MLQLVRILLSYFLVAFSPLHCEQHKQTPPVSTQKIGIKIKGLEPYPKETFYQRAQKLLALDKNLALEEVENCSFNIAKNYGFLLWNNREEAGMKLTPLVTSFYKAWLQWKLNRRLQKKINAAPKMPLEYPNVHEMFYKSPHEPGMEEAYISEGDEDDEAVVATKQNYVNYRFHYQESEESIEELHNDWRIYKRRTNRLRNEAKNLPLRITYLKSHQEFMLYLTAEQLLVDALYGLSQQYNQRVAGIFEDTLDIATRSFFKHIYTKRKAPLLAPSLLASRIATDISYAGGKRFVEKIAGKKIACSQFPIPDLLKKYGVHEKNIEDLAKLIIKFSIKTFIMDKLFNAQDDPVPLF